MCPVSSMIISLVVFIAQLRPIEITYSRSTCRDLNRFLARSTPIGSKQFPASSQVLLPIQLLWFQLIIPHLIIAVWDQHPVLFILCSMGTF